MLFQFVFIPVYVFSQFTSAYLPITLLFTSILCNIHLCLPPINLVYTPALSVRLSQYLSLQILKESSYYHAGYLLTNMFI